MKATFAIGQMVTITAKTFVKMTKDDDTQAVYRYTVDIPVRPIKAIYLGSRQMREGYTNYTTPSPYTNIRPRGRFTPVRNVRIGMVQMLDSTGHYTRPVEVAMSHIHA